MRCAEFDRKSLRVMARVSSVRIVICLGKGVTHIAETIFLSSKSLRLVLSTIEHTVQNVLTVEVPGA